MSTGIDSLHSSLMDRGRRWTKLSTRFLVVLIVFLLFLIPRGQADDDVWVHDDDVPDFWEAWHARPVRNRFEVPCHLDEDLWYGIPEEVDDLISIYESWGKPTTLKNWGNMSVIPCQSWEGVMCRDGHVVALGLPHKGLKGSTDVFMSFSKLCYLDFSNNEMDSGLYFLYSTPDIEYFVAENNPLGPSPSTTGDLVPLRKATKLKQLNLAGCRIRDNLGPLSQLFVLEYLELQENDLEGEFSYLNSYRFRYVNLADNRLYGSINYFGMYMPHFSALIVSNNKLTGSLEPLLQWPMLRNLIVNDNLLSGYLPAKLAELSVLGDFKHNSWWCPIPEEFGEGITCVDPVLSRVYPDWFNESSDGVLLELEEGRVDGYEDGYGCIFRGTEATTHTSAEVIDGKTIHCALPQLPGTDTFVITVSLAYQNQTISTNLLPFQGKYPSERETEALHDLLIAFGSPDALYDWDDFTTHPCYQWAGLRCVRFDGHITSMNLLDMKLDGYLPENIGNLQWLEELYLGGNRLHGGLPPSISQLPSLYHLSLARCLLEGFVADQISSMKNMRILDIASNEFEGTLDFFVHMPQITELYLTRNHFSGQVDMLTHLTQLQIAEIESNDLVGFLPASLANLNTFRWSKNRFWCPIPDVYKGHEADCEFVRLARIFPETGRPQGGNTITVTLVQGHLASADDIMCRFGDVLESPTDRVMDTSVSCLVPKPTYPHFSMSVWLAQNGSRVNTEESDQTYTVHPCAAQSDCNEDSGRGVCHGIDYCVCHFPYSGEDCGQTCSGNGDWSEGHCQCDREWYGDSCDIPQNSERSFEINGGLFAASLIYVIIAALLDQRRRTTKGSWPVASMGLRHGMTSAPCDEPTTLDEPLVECGNTDNHLVDLAAEKEPEKEDAPPAGAPPSERTNPTFPRPTASLLSAKFWEEPRVELTARNIFAIVVIGVEFVQMLHFPFVMLSSRWSWSNMNFILEFINVTVLDVPDNVFYPLFWSLFGLCCLWFVMWINLETRLGRWTERIWGIRVLCATDQYILPVINSFLFFPIILTFLRAWSCSYPQHGATLLVADESIECWRTGRHIVLFACSCIGLALFYPLAVRAASVFQLLRQSLDLVHIVYGEVYLSLSIQVKFLLAATAMLFHMNAWVYLASVGLFVTLLLALNIYMKPCNVPLINTTRSALLAVVDWTVLVALVIHASDGSYNAMLRMLFLGWVLIFVASAVFHNVRRMRHRRSVSRVQPDRRGLLKEYLHGQSGRAGSTDVPAPPVSENASGCARVP